jgi:glycosyltransferase involved in cell wall biosynthesis
MRILQLISSAGYYGAENMLVTLAAELATVGCYAAVGVLQTGDEPEVLLRARERGLPAISLPCSGRLDPGLPGRLNAYLKHERIDILHTHGYKANLYGRWTTHASRFHVATCHNWAVRTGSLGFYSVLDRLALRRVPAVVAVSENVATRLAEFDIRPPRVHIVPNGVDLTRFAQGEARPTLRGELTAAPATLIGSVTRLTAGKGLDVLLTAFSMLPPRHAGVHLALIGSGELDTELRAQAARLNIADRVHFTGARSDMPGVYASLDRLVLASLDEGLPISVLEAMAAGVPVIATRVGAIPQLLQGDAGWLVAPGDPSALAEALVESLDNQSLARQYAQSALARTHAEYSAAAMARGYLELYQSLTGGRA